MSFKNIGWEEKVLGDIFIANYGKSLPKTKRVSGQFNVYGSGGVSGTHNKALIKGPGIIIGRKGTVGSVNYVEDDYYPIDTVYYIEESLNYDIKFLYYKLKTIGLDKMNTHSAVPGLNRDHMYSQKTIMPSLEEQKTIAKILSDLDEKIETNNKINKNLEEMAQAIFKQWFVEFEFPNEEGKPYKSSGGEMVEGELGIIPKGWKSEALGSIIEISSGKRPKKKTKEKQGDFLIPLVGASSIMGYTQEFNLDEEVLIIGRVGTHGVIQRFNYRIWASDNTLVIKSKYIEFVSEILKKIDYNALNRGSTQPLITQTDIKKYSILFPYIELLNEYEIISRKHNKLYEKNKLENQKLEKLRDTLLPKLMSGEIRVPLDNIEN